MLEPVCAWERRYGLLSPARTGGGFRLYDDEDERRVLRMLDHLGAGVSAAEAARLTRVELEDAARDNTEGGRGITHGLVRACERERDLELRLLDTLAPGLRPRAGAVVPGHVILGAELAEEVLERQPDRARGDDSWCVSHSTSSLLSSVSAS